jgi:hypothetical protein
MGLGMSNWNVGMLQSWRTWNASKFRGSCRVVTFRLQQGGVLRTPIWAEYVLLPRCVSLNRIMNNLTCSVYNYWLQGGRSAVVKRF